MKSIFLRVFFFTIAPSCVCFHAQAQKVKSHLIGFDTSFVSGYMVLRKQTQIDSNRLTVLNYIPESKNGPRQMFKIVYDKDTLKSISQISDSCGQPLQFVPAFQGNDIDNLEGFTPLRLNTGPGYYLLFTGFYYGCNGLFCDNGIIMVIKLSKPDKVVATYLFGINKQKLDTENISMIESNDGLIVKFLRLNESEHVTLKLGNDISLSENIRECNKCFFCIK